MNEFICRSGVPSQLHSDQGTNFESKVFVEVCRLLDIEKPGVTPLHPQSDRQVERPPPPPGGEAGLSFKCYVGRSSRTYQIGIHSLQLA